MADLASLETLVANLDAPIRKAIIQVLRQLVPDIRFGHPTGSQPDPMKNIGGGFFQGTTAAIANTEFSIAHNFGRVPYLAWPVLPLDQVGSRVVPLTVTRAADNRRIYLSSSVTDAALTVAVEG